MELAEDDFNGSSVSYRHDWSSALDRVHTSVLFNTLVNLVEKIQSIRALFVQISPPTPQPSAHQYGVGNSSKAGLLKA